MMKNWTLSLLCLACVGLGFAGGSAWHVRRDRLEDEAAAAAAKRAASRNPPRHGIGLPYLIEGNPNGPGHQTYRFGDTWASSREEIIEQMTRKGWQLSPAYKPTDAMIRFVSNAPRGLAPPGAEATGWEKD